MEDLNGLKKENIYFQISNFEITLESPKQEKLLNCKNYC